MRCCTGQARRGEGGQSAVEFALVLPVLMLILMGTIDLGRLYHSYVTVTNAARVGAEYAMDARRSLTDVRQAIKDEASPILTIADADITLTPNPSWTPRSELTVQVRTQFTAITPLISAFWGGGPLTLTGSAKTRFNPPY